ncbi:TonB-dependent receptor domain-containing protein [Escherichia coli]
MAGDWRLYPAKSNHQKRQRCCPGWSHRCRIPREHAFTLWSQYQATDDISVGAGARYIGSMHKGSDGAVGTPAFTEGYWVADAKLGYRVNRNLDFQLNVYNLFDTDYVASINKSGYRYHPGEPRTFCSQPICISDSDVGRRPHFLENLYDVPHSRRVIATGRRPVSRTTGTSRMGGWTRHHRRTRCAS